MAREGEDGYKLVLYLCTAARARPAEKKKNSEQAPLKERKDKKFWEECLFVRRVRCECRKGQAG